MKVSVVIPAYNEEAYIKKCLQSLNSQVVPPDEIIVVDNNCTDNTPKYAFRLGAKVIKEKNQGMIPARNKGFNSAKYELIARCDADVIVPPNWIYKIKQNFKSKDIDALSGPISYYDTTIKSPIPSQIYLLLLKSVTNKSNVLVGPNMALTKKIWNRIKFLVNTDDKSVHEDVDLSLKILKVKGKIGYDQSLVVKTSARRIKNNPSSFLIEYPRRLVKTYWINHKHTM